MKRYMQAAATLLLVVIALLGAGSVLYNKKISSHYIGSQAAQEIKNYAESIVFHIDEFLKNTDATTESQVTTLEIIETYVDQCIVCLNHFQSVANRIESAGSIKFLYGEYTPHSLEVSYMSENLYVFKVFVRRCINSMIQNENMAKVREHMAEARNEISKIFDAFSDNDFSHCKNSRDFLKKYEALISNASFQNLFEGFSSYLK